MWISSGRAEQVFLVASSDTCSCKLLHHILVAPITVTDRSFVTYITSVDSHCLLLVGCYHCVRSVCWPEEFVWWVLFYDQRVKNTWKPSIGVGERMGNSHLCWWRGALGMGENVCGKVCCCGVVKGDGKRKAWNTMEPVYMQWCELLSVVSALCWQCVHFCAWYLNFVSFFGSWDSCSFWSHSVCMLLTWAVSLVFPAWGIRVRSQVMLKQRSAKCGQMWSVLLCHQILQFQEVWPVRLFGYQPV